MAILCLLVFGKLDKLPISVWVSTYGFVSQVTVCLFGSRLAGRCIDGGMSLNSRLWVAQRLVGIEKACLVGASLCFSILFSIQDEKPLLSLILLLIIHVCGAAATLLERAFRMALERDWIVVMSQCCCITEEASSSAWLGNINVGMRQIHLVAQVAAPALGGVLVAAFSSSDQQQQQPHALRGSVLLMGVLHAVALVVECMCLSGIYRRLPSLAIRRNHPEEEETTNKDEWDKNNEEQVGLSPRQTSSCLFARRVLQDIYVYFRQPTAVAGLGLALLYLNALSFSGTMTAYLVWRGMRLETIGIWRGISSAMGLLGTFVFSLLQRKMSLDMTALTSIVAQFLCLTISYISLLVEDTHISSLAMLIGGVCASRVGLWVFDICVTQMMQEQIPQGIRGVVGGVQQALNSLFELVMFGLGILIPDPRDFVLYAAVGYASVGVAMLLFVGGVAYARSSTRSFWILNDLELADHHHAERSID